MPLFKPGLPWLRAIFRDRPAANVAINAVEAALDRKDVPIASRDVPAAAATVVADIQSSGTAAIVPVKSGWLSKINWTQFGALVLSGIEIAFSSLPPETLLLMVGGNQFAAAILTFVLKTWFTKSVTPQSAAKP